MMPDANPPRYSFRESYQALNYALFAMLCFGAITFPLLRWIFDRVGDYWLLTVMCAGGIVHGVVYPKRLSKGAIIFALLIYVLIEFVSRLIAGMNSRSLTQEESTFLYLLPIAFLSSRYLTLFPSDKKLRVKLGMLMIFFCLLGLLITTL